MSMAEAFIHLAARRDPPIQRIRNSIIRCLTATSDYVRGRPFVDEEEALKLRMVEVTLARAESTIKQHELELQHMKGNLLQSLDLPELEELENTSLTALSRIQKVRAGATEELRRGQECVICMTNERAIVFVPCGHFVACAECAARIEECPACRSPIASKLKTFAA